MVSYLVKAVLDLIYLAFEINPDSRSYRQLVYSFEPVELVPVTYVLYIHAKAYQVILAHMRHVSVRPTTVAQPDVTNLRLSEFSVQTPDEGTHENSRSFVD